MVIIKKKQFFFTITEIWYGYKFRWGDLWLPVCYRGIWDMKQPFYFGVKKPTTTVILPLDKPVEDIYNNFFSDTRRAIRNAEAKGVQCYFHNDIKGFIEFYNDFAERKSLATLDVKRMYEFTGEAWSYSYATLNGEVLVATSNIEDKDTGIVRGMQAGSVRLNENFVPKEIANATKLLYYHNIRHFNKKGLKFYDFGGWNDIPGLLAFKQSFGAYPINCLNYFSYTYYLKEKLQELIKFLKRKKH